jgi:hypothetical protein
MSVKVSCRCVTSAIIGNFKISTDLTSFLIIAFLQHDERNMTKAACSDEDRTFYESRTGLEVAGDMGKEDKN